MKTPIGLTQASYLCDQLEKYSKVLGYDGSKIYNLVSGMDLGKYKYILAMLYSKNLDMIRYELDLLNHLKEREHDRK